MKELKLQTKMRLHEETREYGKLTEENKTEFQKNAWIRIKKRKKETTIECDSSLARNYFYGLILNLCICFYAILSK